MLPPFAPYRFGADRQRGYAGRGRWVTDRTTTPAPSGASSVTLRASVLQVLGHPRGDWRGRPPTGRRFKDVDEIYIFRIAGGKLAVVEDNLTRMHQLGIDP